MDLRHTTTIGTVLEHLIANGATDLGRVFGQLFELAMQIEREQYLKAGHRSDRAMPTATSGSTPPLLPFRCQTVTGTTPPVA